MAQETDEDIGESIGPLPPSAAVQTAFFRVISRGQDADAADDVIQAIESRAELMKQKLLRGPEVYLPRFSSPNLKG